MKTKKQTANDELNRTHYSTIQNIWYCICNTAKVRFSILVWCVLLVAPEGANLNTPKRILHFFEKVVAVVLKFSK